MLWLVEFIDYYNKVYKTLEMTFEVIYVTFVLVFMLVALMREALRALPPGDVTVETFRDGDPRGAAALALYRRLGFVPDADLDGYDTPMQILRLCR